MLQWHGDTFDLPQGAILLATSPDCTNQAFRFGKNAYGMLFHNEFTPDWIHEGFEIDENQLLQQARDNSQLMRQQCNRLLANFLNLTI